MVSEDHRRPTVSDGTEEKGKFGGKIVRENSVDVWDAFLGTLENRGLSSVEWESLAPDVQEETHQLTISRPKIDAGVVDGETRLPPDLIWDEYVWRLPEAMCQQLHCSTRKTRWKLIPITVQPQNFWQSRLAGWTSYDIPPDAYWDLFGEKRQLLLPNDLSISAI